MSLARTQRLLMRRGEGTPPCVCEGLFRSILSVWMQPLCMEWFSDARALSACPGARSRDHCSCDCRARRDRPCGFRPCGDCRVPRPCGRGSRRRISGRSHGACGFRSGSGRCRPAAAPSRSQRCAACPCVPAAALRHRCSRRCGVHSRERSPGGAQRDSSDCAARPGGGWRWASRQTGERWRERR